MLVAGVLVETQWFAVWRLRVGHASNLHLAWPNTLNSTAAPPCLGVISAVPRMPWSVRGIRAQCGPCT